MNTVVRIATVVVFCLIVSSSAVSQQASQTTAPRDPKAASAQTSAPAKQAPLAFGLTEDTPIRNQVGANDVFERREDRRAC
jgi:hypothetical protein